jgi:collagenase-like PrtC family protease
MKLSLGPLLYYWDRDTVLDFYARVADAPVDVVYLGEVVCAKRRAMRPDDWLGLAERLTTAGKQAVISTLALVEAESELGVMRRLAHNDRYWVEANDMGAINMLAGRAPFVAGPHINAYNPATLALLAGVGARRWVPPVELGREALAALQRERPAGLETEVFAFGRLPLALSARCFTARAHNVAKDDCGFRCADYPEGMPLASQEGQGFLTVNGIQVQSGQTHNLLPHLEELRALAVDVLRVSPQAHGTFEVIEAFRAALDGKSDAAGAAERVRPHLHGGGVDGYWRGTAGLAAPGA